MDPEGILRVCSPPAHPIPSPTLVQESVVFLLLVDVVGYGPLMLVAAVGVCLVVPRGFCPPGCFCLSALRGFCPPWGVRLLPFSGCVGACLSALWGFCFLFLLVAAVCMCPMAPLRLPLVVGVAFCLSFFFWLWLVFVFVRCSGAYGCLRSLWWSWLVFVVSPSGASAHPVVSFFLLVVVAGLCVFGALGLLPALGCLRLSFGALGLLPSPRP